MAHDVIDRLVSSLAAGLLGTEEFLDAVQNQVATWPGSSGGLVAAADGGPQPVAE
jgi:hypothetical protein